MGRHKAFLNMFSEDTEKERVRNMVTFSVLSYLGFLMGIVVYFNNELGKQKFFDYKWIKNLRGASQ
jgi:predicted TPR repeat methyltransferase